MFMFATTKGLTGIKAPQVSSLVEVSHASVDPHGVVMDDGRVLVSSRRTALASRQHVPRLRL